MRPFLLIFFLYCMGPTAYCQNADSLTRGVDSSAEAIQQTQINFRRWEDSMRTMEMKNFNDRSYNTLKNFLANRKQQEIEERQQLYIRIGLLIVFLTILLIGFIRRRNKKNPPAI